MKLFFRLLLRLLFRFRAYNSQVLNTPGPVLLIPNHVSWIDWLFLYSCLEQDWRCVVSRTSAETSWLHRKIMLNRRTFAIDTTSPYAVKHIAEYLQRNGRLVLFAEGRLSRTGSLMKLFEGTGFLLHKTNARVITCYLRGAQRLPYSPNPNQKRLFPKVTAHFGDPVSPPLVDHVSTAIARTRLTSWLRDRMLKQQFEIETAFGPRSVLEEAVQTSRHFPNRLVLEDLPRQRLTGRRFLIGVDLLARLWKNHLQDGATPIGMLLPNVCSHPLVLFSLWTAQKLPAILNYSTGIPVMLACSRLANLRQIITSRTFLERFSLDPKPFQEAGIELIFLEDVRQQISTAGRLASYVRMRLNPRSLLRSPQNPETPAVILFTSGSEGTPKGVELTQANLLANMRQMVAVIDLVDTDRFFNALPLFHSFGLTIGTLLPLTRGIYCYLYPSPLHFRVVPTAIYHRDATVMFGTNTFLNGYARKAHPYDFRTVRYVFAGAEKLQETTVQTWMRRFGIRIIEGYGATECSPCLSANTPIDYKPGSAGRFLPGISHRLQQVEGVEEGGRLLVQGPNIMRRYLNTDANTDFQELGGWYDTGDIVRVDNEGFVYILGRLKRFAKVSGEMISLAAVEEALAGAFPQFGLRCEVAILSRPDETKGEVLLAVTNHPKLNLDDLRNALKLRGFPNLAMPRELSVVRELPKLGTGKTDHRTLAKLLK